MKRRHEFEAGGGGAAIRLFASGLKVLTMLDEFGAQRLHGAILLDRIAARHQDRHGHAVTARGEGQALAMIAARRRDQSRGAGALAPHPVDIDQSAAHLEGCGRRVVLMLDDHACTEAFRQQRPRMRRRRLHRRSDHGMGALELSEIKHRLASCHTSALPPANAAAVLSSLASAGSSISLWALPEGIIGKQFSSAATRQSNSTGRLTPIISLIAPSRSPGLMA